MAYAILASQLRILKFTAMFIENCFVAITITLGTNCWKKRLIRFGRSNRSKSCNPFTCTQAADQGTAWKIYFCDFFLVLDQHILIPWLNTTEEYI